MNLIMAKELLFSISLGFAVTSTVALTMAFVVPSEWLAI